MNKIKSFLVVSRYKENVDWILDYTDNYIVYNKGDDLLFNFKQIKRPNFGANQYDIFHFIYTNYDYLPDLMTFCQGNPFDHCTKSDFDKWIYNPYYTILFSTHVGFDFRSGIFTELNSNPYLNPTFMPHLPPCKVTSFDEFANSIFEDYSSQSFLTFPPGSQLTVEKERCLYYSKNFWLKLMNFINNDVGLNGGREAHVVERAMQLIFETRFKEKK